MIEIICCSIFIFILLLIIFRAKKFCGYTILINGSIVNIKTETNIMVPITFKTVEQCLTYIKKRKFSKNSLTKNKVVILPLIYNKRKHCFNLGKAILVRVDDEF